MVDNDLYQLRDFLHPVVRTVDKYNLPAIDESVCTMKKDRHTMSDAPPSQGYVNFNPKH
jgi:hypothetical protein